MTPRPRDAYADIPRDMRNASTALFLRSPDCGVSAMNLLRRKAMSQRAKI